MELVDEALGHRREPSLEHFGSCAFHDAEAKLSGSLFVLHGAHGHANELVMLIEIDCASLVSSV